MAAPPPYGPKKSNSTTILFIILGVCGACCVLGVIAVVGAGIFGVKKTKNMIACAIGFEEVSKALETYTKEHGGKLPKADNWQESLRPYFIKQLEKDEDEGSKMFGTFDPEGAWVCKDESGTGQTGIAFNRELSEKNLKDIDNKRTTYILFEVPKTGMNMNEKYVELSMSSSPKIFGQPRGWFHVDANFEVEGTNNKAEFKIGTTSR